MEQLRADGRQGILAMMRCRILCLQFALQTYIDREIRKCNSACFLYGCEIWSLTLREEYSLRVFENRVLWEIFEPMRDETTKEWRGLRNEKL